MRICSTYLMIAFGSQIDRCGMEVDAIPTVTAVMETHPFRVTVDLGWRVLDKDAEGVAGLLDLAWPRAVVSGVRA